MSAARRNPTRFDLVDRIEELIGEYNAGSLNIDEYLRRLISLSHDLSAEERRAVVEDMTEEELAVSDLLTQPQPILDDAERAAVKTSAKRLLAHLHDKLVLDWRRKAATASEVRTTIRDVLDATGGSAVAVLTEPDLDTIAESVVERIRVDAEFASKVAEQLGIVGGAALRTVAEIIENDEDFAVEFKSTARWDLARTSRARSWRTPS